MDREVVKELIQHECTSSNIQAELDKIVIGGNSRKQMLEDFTELKNKLGAGGASRNVAQSLLKTIQS